MTKRIRFLLALAAAFTAALSGCSAGSGEPAGPSAEEAPRPAPPDAVFADAAAETGLDFVHWNGMTGELYMVENMGSGVALVDVDGDGDLDVYLVQGNLLGGAQGRTAEQAIFPPPGPLPLSDQLYRNDLTTARDGRPRLSFSDVSEASGIAAATRGGYGMGVAAGDYDNDGRIDLYVTAYGPNRLLHNEGGGRFRDATRESGTGDDRWSVPAVFFDYDGDGFLDLYVGDYLRFDPAERRPCRAKTGALDYCDPSVFSGESGRLFHNRGDGTFEDRTAAAGLAGVVTKALGAVAADLDGDGFLDLYVANDGLANQLWHNRGDGTFEDLALFAGCAVNGEGAPEASMGVDAGDVDGDGDLDLVMAHLTGQTHTLYRNDGDVFADVTDEAGLGAPSYESTGFGAALLDYDGDGRLDLLVADGAVRTLEGLARAHDPYPLHQPDQLFYNLGAGAADRPRFAEVSARSGPPFALSRVGRGLAVGDVDNDGDPDAVVANSNGAVELLLDQVGSARPWLGLRLVGTAGLRDQLGARVELLRPGGSPLVRRVHTDGSYASSADPRVLFGLGGELPAGSRVRVRWPDGRWEEWPAPNPGRYTVLRQGTGRGVPR